MKAYTCPKCGTGGFIIYQDFGETFVTCITAECDFSMRIHVIPETTRGEE